MSRSAIHRALAVALAGCAAAAALAACNSPGAVGQTSLGGSGPPPATSSTPVPSSAPVESAPPTVATPTATVTVTATAKPPVSHAGYDEARKQWQQGANAISAQMGLYWDNAATDLTTGLTSDTGDTSGYKAAIKELKELISLPDAQQTPQQNAAFHADINALNTFFHTPGLYS
jgi:hypothetical protein